jgi:hypothetical protein
MSFACHRRRLSGGLARAFRPVTSTAARAWRPVDTLVGRMPLRVKLISAVLVLVAAALAVVSVASISALRGYLLDQADQQLTGYANSITIRHGNGLCIGQMAPSQYWSELLDKTGHPVTIRCSIPPAPGASPAAGPARPVRTG